MEPEDRFERYKLIQWWEQDKLSSAKVLVIGAGAIGNEVLKNLALLGTGNIFIIDMDKIENSNLSRAVLFREKDEGKYKAETASKIIKELYPKVNVNYYIGNVINDIGMGIFRWADVVICCVDNREARVCINKNCSRLNKPWIDGGTENINGVVRVFMPPEGACYECTMNETDWNNISQRKGCGGLTRDQIIEGKIPTTPTSSSIVAAYQVQEFIKFIHGFEVMKSKGLYINGMTNDSYIIEYPKLEDCLCHYAYEDIRKTGKGICEIKLSDLFEKSKDILGDNTILEFPYDIVQEFICDSCHAKKTVYKKINTLKESDSICDKCQNEMRADVFNKFEGQEEFGNFYFSEIDISPFEIISARNKNKQIYWEFDGDIQNIFSKS